MLDVLSVHSHSQANWSSRLGSCGGLSKVPVGSLVVPTSSVAVRRNYDYDFTGESETPSEDSPYLVSKPVSISHCLTRIWRVLKYTQAFADPELHATVCTTDIINYAKQFIMISYGSSLQLFETPR